MLSLLFGIKKDTVEKKDDEAVLNPLTASQSSVPTASIQSVPSLAHSPQLEKVKRLPGDVDVKKEVSLPKTIDTKPRAGSPSPLSSSPIAITPPSASYMPMANRDFEKRTSLEQQTPDDDYAFSVGSPPGVHDARRKPVELRYKKH